MEKYSAANCTFLITDTTAEVADEGSSRCVNMLKALKVFDVIPQVLNSLHAQPRGQMATLEHLCQHVHWVAAKMSIKSDLSQQSEEGQGVAHDIKVGRPSWVAG